MVAKMMCAWAGGVHASLLMSEGDSTCFVLFVVPCLRKRTSKCWARTRVVVLVNKGSQLPHGVPLFMTGAALVSVFERVSWCVGLFRVVFSYAVGRTIHLRDLSRLCQFFFSF